jgi:hypothetical protein
MMQTVGTSETPVNSYQITGRNVSENSHIHMHRRENLKSRIKGTFSNVINIVRIMNESYVSSGKVLSS